MPEDIDWQSALIGALLGIPITVAVGYLVNLTTPNLKDWLRLRREERKKSKVEKLEDLERQIQKCRSNMGILYLSVLDTQSRMMYVLMLGIFALFADSLWGNELLLVFVFGVISISAIHAARHINYHRAVHNYMMKPEDLERRIEELKQASKEQLEERKREY